MYIPITMAIYPWISSKNGWTSVTYDRSWDKMIQLRLMYMNFSYMRLILSRLTPNIVILKLSWSMYKKKRCKLNVDIRIDYGALCLKSTELTTLHLHTNRSAKLIKRFLPISCLINAYSIEIEKKRGIFMMRIVDET